MDQDPNKQAFIKRFWLYQKERFPLLFHGLLISSFTFSAISYSRICRAQDGFIETSDFIIGIFATITLFLLVRIFDEFKDREDDAKYRKYLPVPRGLIKLKELRNLGIAIATLQVAAILIWQKEMIWLYALVLLYLCLMGVEFFVPQWLKRHQLAYIGSHMLIIPLIDLYSSGLDWKLDGAEPHIGLLWFFVVSFFNGLVLEWGRKIRTPQTEEEGVVSYTGLYGTKKAVWIWIGILAFTLLLALGAAHYASYASWSYLAFSLLFILCCIPAILFLKSPSEKMSKWLEYSSALWSLFMYFLLGAIPMLIDLI